MSLLTIVLLLYLMREFATILQELFIAAAVAYLILPAHYWLVRRRVPPWLSGLILVLTFMAASYGLGQVLYYNVSELAGNASLYQRNLSRMLEHLADRIPGVDRELLNQIIVGQSATVESSIGMIRSALGSFFSFLTTAVVVLVYLFFIVAEQFSFRRRIQAAFDPARAARILSVVAKINESIIQYIAVKTAMSLLTGALTIALLTILDVDYAVLWGIFAFLLNYIPYLGSIIATLLPTILALVTKDSLWWGLLTLVSLGLVQNGIAYVVEPRVAGNRLNLSPLVILLALAFGGTVWGIVGMILAVPLVVIVKAVLENIEDTRPIAAMMSHM